MTSPFILTKYKIECNIPYSAHHNITQAILDHLDQFLFKLSYKLQGIVVSYNVEQFSQQNKIYPDSPFMFIDCIVELLILRIDVPVYCKDGSIFEILKTNDNHTGYIMIKEVDDNNVVTKYIIPRKT